MLTPPVIILSKASSESVVLLFVSVQVNMIWSVHSSLFFVLYDTKHHLLLKGVNV